MERARTADWMGRVLDAAEAASPVEAVESVTGALGLLLGATSVSFLIADLSGRGLVRMAHVPLQVSKDPADHTPMALGERRELEERATVLPFDGGPTEQVVRGQGLKVFAPGSEFAEPGQADQWRVLAPVTERGEMIGLLEFLLPEEPNGWTTWEIAQLAHLLAFVVIANRRHTDLYEWGQRTRPLSLSAEIQHRLLPGPQTCEAGAFTLAGWLEPAAGIAGDTFDFSLARDLLHLSLTDAMGHGVGAALSATLCVGSLRNTRNQGASLLEQVAAANLALVEHSAGAALEDFVTGLVGRVDLRTGSMALVNAGHVSPYLVRGVGVTAVELLVDLPLGLFPDTPYRSTTLRLAPGDRLVLVTDGMLERNAAGMDLAQAIADTRMLHPREAVRALADRVLSVTDGVLADDATVLCLDWLGDHGRDRRTVHGADRAEPHPGPDPTDQEALPLNAEDMAGGMAGDAVGQPGARRLLTLGRVDRVRVQVGYRARPDGPAQQQFLLDLPVPATDSDVGQDLLDESQVLTALEPVLYVGGDAPRHYSLHQHRWHTSWGPSPGALDIGLLVTTGSRTTALSGAPLVGVVRAFRSLLEAAGRPEPTPISRDAAILRARQSAATAYALDPETMSLSAEEHHPSENSWALGLRTTAGDEYDVVVGLVDGFAGSVRVKHVDHVEVFDAVGSE